MAAVRRASRSSRWGCSAKFRMNARAPTQHRVQPVEVQAEAAVGLRVQISSSSSAPRSARRWRYWPSRAVQHHAVAGAHGGGQRHRHRGHAGGGDLDRSSATAWRAGRSGRRPARPAARHATHIRIAGEAGVQRGDGGVARGLRAWLVGFPKHRNRRPVWRRRCGFTSTMREPGMVLMSMSRSPILLPHRRPNSRSISAFDSLRNVGRPWLHVAARGVASIWRSSASISAAFNLRPARIEPWHASRAITASSRACKRVALVERRQFVGEVAQQRSRFGCAQRRRQRPHHHRAGPERLDLQPEPRQLVAARQQARRIGRRQVHHRGQQQRLHAHAAIQHLRRAVPRASGARARRADRPAPASRRPATAIT